MSTCCEGLPKVFKWDQVQLSGVFAVAFNALLLSLMWNNLGVVYLLTNFLFATTLITIVYLAFLKFVLKTEEPKEDTQYAYISEETVQGLIITLVNTVNSVTKYFKETHQSVFAQIKLIGGLYLAAQVLGGFSIITITWLAVNGLLVYGFVAFKLGMNVCGLAHTYYDLAVTKAQSVLDLIPKYQPAK